MSSSEMKPGFATLPNFEGRFKFPVCDSALQDPCLVMTREMGDTEEITAGLSGFKDFTLALPSVLLTSHSYSGLHK